LDSKHFLDFSAEGNFRFKKRKARRVMISLEGTNESWLSDGAAKLSIRTAIEQFPLLKSIFHLL
jgi:hypothetical protein